MMTKKQFDAYVEVQKSGQTNMFDVQKVIELNDNFGNVHLTREDCLDIMRNYEKYEKEYK